MHRLFVLVFIAFLACSATAFRFSTSLRRRPGGQGGGSPPPIPPEIKQYRQCLKTCVVGDDRPSRELRREIGAYVKSDMGVLCDGEAATYEGNTFDACDCATEWTEIESNAEEICAALSDDSS